MSKTASKETITDDDLALLTELGIDITPAPIVKRTAREERIIAGFEEIERFVVEHGRHPQHGEERDIFERLYAVRLDRLRALEECRTLLQPLDRHNLLDAEADPYLTAAGEMTDEALLAALGVDASAGNDITQLKHVRSRSEIKAAAEEVAQRTPCEDFDQFQPIFNAVQHDLDTGMRHTVKYQDNAKVELGGLFILDGQKVLVAEIGPQFVSDHGRPDHRLRVVYDNATESDLLLRSLQRALNKDRRSRRITTPDLGPLFASLDAESDIVINTSTTNDDVIPVQSIDEIPTGRIYVLRSRSDHSFIAENRTIIHKIGVTGGDVKSRIANAKKDATYLLADVDIVATFKLPNIDPQRFETLLHKFFSHAQLDLTLIDRFGTPVKPQEWFLVPLAVIEEVIDKINDGSIEQFRYDVDMAQLVQA